MQPTRNCTMGVSKAMHSFQIGNLTVTANTREQAQQIATLVTMTGGGKAKLIVIEPDGTPRLLELPSTYTLYHYDGAQSVTHCGDVSTNSNKLIGAAVESYTRSLEQRKKLHSIMNNQRSAANMAGEENLIRDFEDSMPDICRPIWQDMKSGMFGSKHDVAETISQIVCQCKPTTMAWPGILSWFKSQVFDDNMHKSIENQLDPAQLRRAFVTAVVRMVGKDITSSNTIAEAAQTNNRDDYWLKYAEGKK